MTVVYQTWKSCEFPKSLRQYHNSWLDSNFVVNLSNDTTFYNDLHNLASIKLRNKLKQFTLIQKLDIWRYLKIFHNGGLYVDIDIGLFQSEKLMLKTNECNLVLFSESPSVKQEPIKYIVHALKYFFGLNDHSRLFQFRQSIFYAKKNHKLFEILLKKIQNSNVDIMKMKFIEPTYTYELTGPGIFTDNALYFADHPDTCIIGYNEGLELIDYHHIGTWKHSFKNVEYLIHTKNTIILCSILINVCFACFCISRKYACVIPRFAQFCSV